MCDQFVEELVKLKRLKYLDLSDPTHSCSEDLLINLMEAVGGGLTHLNLSKHTSISDEFFVRGLAAPHTRTIQHLTLSHLPELSDEGIAAFFSSWQNAPLVTLDLSRNITLGSATLLALLQHSGERLEVLNINGWKDVGVDALEAIGKLGREIKRLDVGWCREVDDFVVKGWMEGDKAKGYGGCMKLQELKFWGCNRVTAACPRKVCNLISFLADGNS